tara:strand:+ start:13 stop:651 length:639 start_codon:yes stop_codon:yes gene_type:complete
MTNKNNYFDTTTIILLGLLVLLLVFSIPLFMNNSKINNITRDLDIIETFSNCNKQHFGTKKEHFGTKKEHFGPKKDHFGTKKEHFGNKKEHESFSELKREGGVRNPLRIQLYTMSGCGHCDIFKNGEDGKGGEWSKIKRKFNGAGGVPLAVEINESNPKYDELVSRYGIKGYPHIQLTRDGKKLSEYSGSRTYSDIIKWYLISVRIHLTRSE